MQHHVSVRGRDLVVDRPYSSRPRLLVGEEEMPKDRWGHYLWDETAESPERVAVKFDFRQLAPRVDVGDTRAHTVPPLPAVARFLLLGVLVLGAFGGALGVALAITAVMLSAQQLRRPHRQWLNIAAAAAIPIAAGVLYFVAATVIARL